MLKGLITMVNDRIAFLEMLSEELVKQLKAAPPGKIRAVRKKGVIQCYQRILPSDKSGKYLKSNQKELGIFSLYFFRAFFLALLQIPEPPAFL